MRLKELGRWQLDGHSSWQQEKHVRLYSDLLHRIFDNSGFLAEGTLISVSVTVVPSVGVCSVIVTLINLVRKRERKEKEKKGAGAGGGGGGGEGRVCCWWSLTIQLCKPSCTKMSY